MPSPAGRLLRFGTEREWAEVFVFADGRLHLTRHTAPGAAAARALVPLEGTWVNAAGEPLAKNG